MFGGGTLGVKVDVVELGARPPLLDGVFLGFLLKGGAIDAVPAKLLGFGVWVPCVTPFDGESFFP